MKNKRIVKRNLSIKKVCITIITIISIAIIICLIMGNNQTLSHTSTEYKKIYVSNGETLWEISNREINNNDYYENKDIRYVINDIKTINNLQTSSLSIGQEISIPVI